MILSILKGLIGEIFPCFRQTTPRPPYGAGSPAPL